MDDLIARINIEIERDIELASGEDEQAHSQRHWPDRIERQAAAFRKILELHETDRIQPTLDSRGHTMWPNGGWLCKVCSPWHEGEQIYADAGYEGRACATVLALAEVYGIEP